jgi:glycosyl transferase, family 25
LKCLVINLDRCADRLAHMRAAFERLGLAFERLPAVDGGQLPAESINDINARNQWVRPLTRAEIGCLLSHVACWQAIAAGDEPYGAVFEDDIRISPNAAALLRSSTWLPQGADFIKIETRNRPVTVSRRTQGRAEGRQLFRLLSFHDGLGGYILSKSCARWLCARVQERTAPIDQLVLNPEFGVFGQLNVLQLAPAICIPNQIARRGDASLADIASTIDPNGDLYKSDEQLLQQARPPRDRGSARRNIDRLLASLQRGVRGQKRVRIAFR